MRVSYAVSPAMPPLDGTSSRTLPQLLQSLSAPVRWQVERDLSRAIHNTTSNWALWASGGAGGASCEDHFEVARGVEGRAACV